MHSIDGCMFFVIVRGPIGNTYEPVDGYELPPMRGGNGVGVAGAAKNRMVDCLVSLVAKSVR